MTKTKKVFLWASILGVVLFALGALGWVFHDQLLSFWNQTVFSHSKNSPKGVPRRISTTGRLREAKSLMGNGYFSLATVELQNAIRENPESPEPYRALGEVYLRTQDMTKLQNLIKELGKIFPGDPEIPVLKGRKLIAEQNFQEASTFFRQTKGPLSPSLHFYQAVLAALQNNHAGAQQILSDIASLPVKKDTLTPAASEDTASVPPELAEKVQGMLDAYETFQDLSEGQNPHLFALLGKVLAEKNEATLAQKFAEVAIKEDVSYIDAWIVRGYANMQMGKIDAALEDLRHAYDLDPLRPQTHYFLALALDKAGKTDEAILFFEKSLEHNFEFSDEVRWKLVDLFSRGGKYDRVVELYRELLNSESEPTEYVRAMHTAIDILKQPEVALEFADRLIKEKPDDAFSLNMHGWALVVNKKFIQAEKDLKEALDLEPENPRTFLNLGLLAEEQAEFEKAKEFYKKSYEMGKTRTDELSVSLTNAAAERYNSLMSKIEHPEEPAAEENPKNSP